MSSPTSRLSKLSLGRMPTTRAQSSAQSQSEKQDPGEEEFDSEAASSDLEYDTAQLTPRSKERFEAAREGHFEIAQCGERDEGGHVGKYYVFEIAETTKYSIRIQEPGKKYGHLPCYPGHQGPEVCRHVFWLTDQIARHTLTDPQKEDKLTQTRRGYPSGVPDPYRQISTFGIENLAEGANWQVTEEDEEVDNPERRHLAMRKRAREVREIMAALSSSSTADEYRPDIFNNLSEANVEQPLVSSDLEATLARLLMTKNDMLHHFRGLIPPNYCASDFFQKMQERARSTLDSMDAYFHAGATGDQTEPHDVAWCASELTKIIASIRSPLANMKLGKDAKESAAKALVYILGDVVNRDYNNYAGPGWAKSQQRLQHDRERNLYHRLINSTALTTNSSFILSELDLIDAIAAHYSVTELEGILEAMTAAPSAYKARLRDLINRWKSAEAPSGQKRPGEAAGSSPKRRMK